MYLNNNDDKKVLRRINTGHKKRSDDNLYTIVQTKKFSHKDTLKYILELAYIVEHLHVGYDCVHGNISPKNIFECSERDSRYLKLEKDLYLGVPEFVEHSSKDREYLELCHYKAPEVVNNQTETWEYNTDIYGLGMTMFYMVTKRLPYQNSQEFESYITEQKKIVPSEYNNEVSKGVDRICGKAINHNPEERYQAIGELIADLRKEVELSAYRKFRLFLWR